MRSLLKVLIRPCNMIATGQTLWLAAFAFESASQLILMTVPHSFSPAALVKLCNLFDLPLNLSLQGHFASLA